MAKLSDLSVDAKRIEEGQWFDYPDVDGVRVCVRSKLSEAYRKRRAFLLNRLPTKRRKLGDSTADFEQIARLAAPDLLTGWDGIEDESGSPIEFDIDTARKMATEKRYWRFFERIDELADEVGHDEALAREETIRD